MIIVTVTVAWCVSWNLTVYNLPFLFTHVYCADETGEAGDIHAVGEDDTTCCWNLVRHDGRWSCGLREERNWYVCSCRHWCRVDIRVPSGLWKSLKVLEFKRCKFKTLKIPWKWRWSLKVLEKSLKMICCFCKMFICWKFYWAFCHVTVKNVTLEGLFVKKYSGWNIRNICIFCHTL